MTAELLDGWSNLGAHLFRVEEPDVFFMRLRGDVSGPQMARMLDEVERFAAGRQHVFWISDASRLGDMSLEARKIAARADLTVQLRGAVIYGASFQQRVMTKLLVKSASVFRKTTAPVEFTATEAEARAWVEAQRHTARAELASAAAAE